MAIEWFESNYMKLNTDKCHLLIGGNKSEHIYAKIGNDIIWESKEERLLGVTIDNQLKFDTQITDLCKMAHKKLSALIRYTGIMNFEKRRTLMKSLVESQFSYSPLTWMFHNRNLEHKINRIHERALRCVYLDDISPSFSNCVRTEGIVSTGWHFCFLTVALQNYRELTLIVYLTALLRQHPSCNWSYRSVGK